MLRIRLARTGAKKKPNYRVVVIERERARDGRFVEILGHYDPTTKPVRVSIDRERFQYWVGKGAQPSDTVSRLVQRSAERPGSEAPA